MFQPYALSRRFVTLFIVFSLVILAFPLSVTAQPFNQDSYLVSADNNLFEFSPTGAQIQVIPIPRPNGERSRDIVVTTSGEVAVYNGTFSPVLSIYNPETDTWRDMTAPEWNTVNNGTYGGIAAYGGSVYVTDMLSDLNGIIQFNMDGSYIRHLVGNEYIDLTLGLDGLMYALRDMYGRLDIIDPSTMQVIRNLSLDFGAGIRGVMADAQGTIYAAAWSGDLIKYDSNGIEIDRRWSGVNNLEDIDINATGAIIFSDWNQTFHVADANLNVLFQYTVPVPYYADTFVAFAQGVIGGPAKELTESQRLYDFSGQSGDGFGEIVDIANDKMIVAAPWAGNSDSSNRASVFIFEKVNGTWQEKNRLANPAPNSDPFSYDDYGKSAAISGDFAVIGAPGQESTPGIRSGAVFVYHRTPNGSWEFIQQINHPYDIEYSNFGEQVEISGDVIAIAAPNDYRSFNQGVVYVYRKNTTGIWELDSEISDSGGTLTYGFGYNIAITESELAVTAYDTSTSSNIVLTYFKLPGQNYWSNGQTIYKPAGLDQYANFAGDIAISGNLLVIGAEPSNLIIYQKIDTVGPWEMKSILSDPEDPAPPPGFGARVAIDGNRIAVSRPSYDNEKVFIYQGNGADNWSLSHILSSANTSAAGEAFGFGLAISGDTVITGAPNANGQTEYSGVVYVFDLSGGQPPQPGPDSDGDGMPDDWEISYGLDPYFPGDANADLDYDLLTNLQEYQQNTDPKNPDTDGDTLFDGEEVQYTGTNPTLADTDGDGMPDGWEVMNGLDPLVNDANVDLDNDGLNNLDEYNNGTDPHNMDSDWDGLQDGYEVNKGFNPTNPDSDSDGMWDGWEDQYGLNPLSASDASNDADGDGLNNVQEFQVQSNPNLADTDGDTLTDAQEVNIYYTNPSNADSDYDGLNDGIEVNTYKTDPNSTDTDGDTLNDSQEVNTYSTNPLKADSDDDGMPDDYEVKYNLLPNNAADALQDPDGDGFTSLAEYQFIDHTDPNNKDHYPGGPGTTKWKLNLGVNTFAAPTLGRDGTIYIISSDGTVNAVNPDGTIKWSNDLSIFSVSGTSVAIGHDDTIYAVLYKTLYALDLDGNVRWSYDLPGASYTTPTIGHDGTIYVGTYANSYQNLPSYFYAIKPDGTLRWTYQTTGNVRFSAAIGHHGNIYATATDGSFYSFSPDGSLNWRQQLQYNLVMRPPVILRDGSLFVQYSSNASYIVQTDGSYTKISDLVYSNAIGSAVVDIDDSILTSRSFDLIRLKADGTEIWSVNNIFIGGSSFGTAPVIGKSGSIYIGTYAPAMQAFNADGSLKWIYKMSTYAQSAPVIANDGTLYTAGYDGTLYALNTASGGLADSAWPTENHDSLRTGNSLTGTPKLVNEVLDNVSSVSWTTVKLDKLYRSPVVISTVEYGANSPPAVVRIQNAANDQFDIKIQRLDGSSDPITARVHYIVLEEGVYNQTAHGVTMEAVKYTSTRTDRAGSWIGEKRTYQNTYSSPVVLGQVMSANDAGFSAFWSRGNKYSYAPSANTLYTGKHVAEDPDRSRVDETIGYMVIEAGSGTIGNYDYLANRGDDTIRGLDVGPHLYGISGLSAPVSAIATQVAMDGGNGGWAVLTGSSPVNASDIKLGIDEDQLKDKERSHTTEQVDYFVLQPR